MIGVTLSGKTRYREANFEHEVIALSYFDNSRKKELNYIEECLKEGKDIVVDDTNRTLKIRKQHRSCQKIQCQDDWNFHEYINWIAISKENEKA